MAKTYCQGEKNTNVKSEKILHIIGLRKMDLASQSRQRLVLYGDGVKTSQQSLRVCAHSASHVMASAQRMVISIFKLRQETWQVQQQASWQEQSRDLSRRPDAAGSILPSPGHGPVFPGSRLLNIRGQPIRQ